MISSTGAPPSLPLPAPESSLETWRYQHAVRHTYGQLTWRQLGGSGHIRRVGTTGRPTSLINLTSLCSIYGITCVQTYLYYTKYSKNDQLPMKFMIATLWQVIDNYIYIFWVVSRVLDSIHLALVTMMVYHYTISNWGDAIALSRTTWYCFVEFSPRTCGWPTFRTLEVQIVVAVCLHCPDKCYCALTWCGRDSWLWLYSASSPIESGVVSAVSLWLVGSSICNTAAICLVSKNWTLTAVIVGPLKFTCLASRLLMPQSGAIITVWSRCVYV